MKYYIYEGSPESRDETYRFATKREALRYMKGVIALKEQLGLDWVASVMLAKGCVYVQTDATAHYYDRLDQIAREQVAQRKEAITLINPPAPEPVEAAPTIIDLKELSLEQVSEMYRNGTISAELTEEYIELWNRGPHMTKAQLTDGVIRNYLVNPPTDDPVLAEPVKQVYTADIKKAYDAYLHAFKFEQCREAYCWTEFCKLCEQAGLLPRTIAGDLYDAKSSGYLSDLARS